MTNTQQKFLSKFHLPTKPSIEKIPNLILFPKQGILRGYSGGARRLLEHGTQVDFSDNDQYSTRSLDSDDFTLSNSSKAPSRKMSSRNVQRRKQSNKKGRRSSNKPAAATTGKHKSKRSKKKAKRERKKIRSRTKKSVGKSRKANKKKTIHKRKSKGCNRFKSIL